MISVAIAVVAVMSVQPTSENLTVLQLGGSPANEGCVIPTSALAAAINAIEILIVRSPCLAAIQVERPPPGPLASETMSRDDPPSNPPHAIVSAKRDAAGRSWRLNLT